MEILKGDGDKLSFKLVLQVQLTFEHVQSEHEFDSADQTSLTRCTIYWLCFLNTMDLLAAPSSSTEVMCVSLSEGVCLCSCQLAKRGRGNGSGLMQKGA